MAGKTNYTPAQEAELNKLNRAYEKYSKRMRKARLDGDDAYYEASLKKRNEVRDRKAVIRNS
ncbi:hypothetical protein [Bernardetia sp.]|uniref:hypothetical protein n=1 Tax=Bernardetia sp. TaxID=1937974 RepID=UPI0025C52274|nr:hypothetical protein [Bernardetia sp.]